MIGRKEFLEQAHADWEKGNFQEVCKKLEANQPVTSIAYSNLSPRYKG